MNDFKKPWVVSDYLDIGQYGVIDNDGRIVIGISAKIDKERLEYIVTAVNGEKP